MIQRKQTLWLLLSAVCGVLSFFMPFYSGQLKDGKYDKLNAGYDFFLILLTGVSVLLALTIIFLYKKRKLQLRLCVLGIIFSLINVVVYFLQIQKFQTGSVSLSCLLAFGIIVGYIMAARGIWKDEKLIKTLDRLR